METSIDPQLRDHSQSAPHSAYPSLTPSHYALNPNPIRLPPPQQQHHQHPWPQTESPLYFGHRGQHAHNLPPPPEVPPHHDTTLPPPSQSDQGPSESKRPRACEACRGLKVRCEPDPTKGTCRRCAKAGRPCVVTAPSRKRQKKTDSRVAELEKKIDALTASLQATKAQAASESDDDSFDDQDPSRNIANRSHRVSDYSLQGDHRPLENARSAQKPSESYQDTSEGVAYQSTMGNERKRRLSQYPDDEPGLLNQEISSQHLNADVPANIHSSAPSTRPPMHNGTVKSMSSTNSNSASPTHEYADVVDRKILDAALASQIFQHYTQNMAGHMPLVVFPPETSAGAIRKTKPTLFLAILSVASGQDHPDIHRILAKEILRAFADRVVYKGEKSLELIQALQVVTIWYWPEDNREAQTYQLIHMAAVMAVDLGIGRRTKGGREPYHALWKDYPRMKLSAHADDNVESQRAWLGCYLLCANAAMGLKRSNLMRWNSHMDECLDKIDSAEGALQSDSSLIQWVRLQRLADEVSIQLAVDDSTNIGISDRKTQYALKGFERQMKEWEKQKPKDITSLPLTLSYHVVNLYMHEVAMHLDQGVESPKSPRARENGGHQAAAAQSEVLTTAHIGALTTCLTSIHGLFDTFLKFSAEEVRTVPVFYFVRIAYATVLLIKMYFAATSPESEFGKVIASDDMRVEHYLSSLRNLLQAAAAYGKCLPARSSSLVLVMLQTWFERQRDGKSGFSEEISGSTRPDAQPVDISHHAPKQEYKRMQLNGDPPPTRRSSAPQAPAQASAEGMDQSRLHVLGEVALGNSSANGHHLGHSGDQWNSFQAHPMGTTSHAYPAYDYPAPVATMDAGPYDTVMHGYHSGLEQAIGMTFNEGNLSYMDDYALYNMMQMPNIFENVG